MKINRDRFLGGIYGYRAGGSSFYVRPSGGSYGDENGSSYANAWDGFSNIDWGLVVSGSTLVIAGTHTEALVVGSSGVKIAGDYSGDAGIIDSENTRGTGMSVISKSNVIISDLAINNATGTNLSIEGTSTVVTNNIVSDVSGNQGIGHTDTAVATHNNPNISNCADEAMSGHDSVIIKVYAGNIHDNNAGFNTIVSSQLFLYDDITFAGNTDDVDSSAFVYAENIDFTSNVRAGTNGDMELNNCTISGVGSLKAENELSCVANNCVIGNARPEIDGEITLNDCIFYASNVFGILNVNRCRYPDNITGMLVRGAGTLVARHTLFEKHSGGEKIKPLSGGIIDIQYCVLYSNSGSGEFVEMPSGGVLQGFTNNTIIVGSKTGFINATGSTQVVENNILTECVRALSGSPNIITANNNCEYDNSNADNGTVNHTGLVSTDPLITDAVNLDFSLGVGSSAIGTGKTLTVTTGIDTADWGNGTTTTPVIITKEQTGSWDIGAYIS